MTAQKESEKGRKHKHTSDSFDAEGKLMSNKERRCENKCAEWSM